MNRTWRLSALGLALPLFSGGCAFIVGDPYPERAEAPFSTTVDAAGLDAVAIDTENGAVEVECLEDLTEVRIDAVKHARGKTEEDAQQYVEGIEIDVGRDPQDPGRLHILVKFPHPKKHRSPGVSFRLRTPPSVAYHVRTSNGHVELTGARREVDIGTSNGRVEVTGVDGDIRARSSNGPIIAHEIKGAIDVKTSNGGIVLEDVEGRSLRAVTSNGRVQALRTSGDVSLKSSNAAVELRVKSLSDVPAVSVETSNGKIFVEVPPTNLNARLKMRTSNARVRADLPDVGVNDLESGKNHLAATINDGEGMIELASSNGAVTFQVRQIDN